MVGWRIQTRDLQISNPLGCTTSQVTELYLNLPSCQLYLLGPTVWTETSWKCPNKTVQHSFQILFSDCWSFYFPSGNLVTSPNSTSSFSPNNDSLQMLEIKNIPVILSMSCKDWSLSMASCVRRPNWQASSSSNTTLVSWKPSNLLQLGKANYNLVQLWQIKTECLFWT